MKSKQLIELGFPKEIASIAAKEIGREIGKGLDPDGAILIAQDLLKGINFIGSDASYKETISAMQKFRDQPKFETRKGMAPYKVWGIGQIEKGALDQMTNACKLPVAVRGSLMPDAHQGYGLPIGGVLATDNCVIPYAVGVDISCRMKMSVFDASISNLEDIDRMKNILTRETRFGLGCNFQGKSRHDHKVMNDERWNFLPILKDMKDVAWGQLGTSGGGNHFVEFGIYMSMKGDKHLALLSHSGSRGPGSKVANHYSKLAMELRSELPDELKHLAWLDLNSEAGMEYWAAMSLMGDYAAANHNCIHLAIARSLDCATISSIENNHNFAWKERHFDQDVIVHRKGATPAQKGVMGIIPGSMASPAYIVEGKGDAKSLSSAAHGAGRLMSRKKAKVMFNWEDVNKDLVEKGITLISAGLDESSGSYKNIDDVMLAQTDLVKTIGIFNPKIVRMADEKNKQRRRK